MKTDADHAKGRLSSLAAELTRGTQVAQQGERAMAARRAGSTPIRVLRAAVTVSILVVSILAAAAWAVFMDLFQRTGTISSTSDRLGGALMVVLVGGVLAALARWLVSNLGPAFARGKRVAVEVASALGPTEPEAPTLRCGRCGETYPSRCYFPPEGDACHRCSPAQSAYMSLDETRARYGVLSTEELLAIATDGTGQYRLEAQRCAADLLASRGISAESPRRGAALGEDP
jgi:hypothetical protein